MKTIPALLLPVAFAAAAAGAAPLTVDSVVASVNGEPVMLSDVRAAMRPHLEAARRADPRLAGDPDALFRAAWSGALADAENRRLVVQRYWAGDARIPPQALERAATERIEKQYGGDVHALQLELAREGLTYSEWKDDLEEFMIVSNMRQLYVGSNVHVSPGDVAREWETNRAAYVEAPRVHVAIAAFPGSDADAPAAFRARLAAGERFDWLVSKPSEEARLAGAGDYGWIDPRASLAPTFADAVLALPDGGVSDPVALGGWNYLLCRVESEKRAEPTLAETWEKIEDALWNRASDALYRAWIAQLRDGAAIREYPPEGL